MNVIIVGCGRVGASLAKVLDTPDNEVTVIDQSPAALALLGTEFQGRTVVGQGYDEEILNAANAYKCDAFAAVTSSDNVNLMASEVARRLYKVRHVITRLVNPARMELYEQLGLDYICDTELVAESISAKIRSRHAYHIETFGEYELFVFTLVTAGRVIHVRDLESLGDVRISLFEHDGESFVANPGMYLHDGDKVFAVAHESALPKLAAYMKG